MFAPQRFSLPLILLALCAMLTGCDDNASPETETAEPQVAVTVIQPQDLSVYDTLPGRVNATTGLLVKLLLPDGTAYNQPGRILFSGMSVDTSTGQVLVRIEIKNPDRELLPGMFVRVQVPGQHYDDALMIPGRARAVAPD